VKTAVDSSCDFRNLKEKKMYSSSLSSYLGKDVVNVGIVSELLRAKDRLTPNHQITLL